MHQKGQDLQFHVRGVEEDIAFVLPFPRGGQRIFDEKPLFIPEFFVGNNLCQMIIGGRPVVETQFPRFLGNRGGGNVEIRNDAHIFRELITRLANVDIHRDRIPLGDCVPERRIKDLERHVEIVAVVLPIVRDTQLA